MTSCLCCLRCYDKAVIKYDQKSLAAEIESVRQRISDLNLRTPIRSTPSLSQKQPTEYCALPIRKQTTPVVDQGSNTDLRLIVPRSRTPITTPPAQYAMLAINKSLPTGDPEHENQETAATAQRSHTRWINSSDSSDSDILKESTSVPKNPLFTRTECQ